MSDYSSLQQLLPIPIPPQQKARASIGASEQGFILNENCLQFPFPQPQKKIKSRRSIIQVQLQPPVLSFVPKLNILPPPNI
jgi:hypothetical protein